jgi:lipoprotein NlpI
MRIISFFALVLLTTLLIGQGFADETDVPPLTEAQLTELTKSFEKSLDEAAAKIQKNPESVGAYSQHGDACFFLGKFKEAVADYDKMNELQPAESSSNWRRGIALFYAGRYEDAAAQFESYHSFDQVDRENGIWRYLSQYKAYGPEKARQGLLKYKKDDREPFPAVYKLFAGTIPPEQILNEISKADVPKAARESRLFYAHLYIGLNYAVEGQADKARSHLAEATRNNWPRSADYGPHYMWQVGRLHEELLRSKSKEKKP